MWGSCSARIAPTRGLSYGWVSILSSEPATGGRRGGRFRHTGQLSGHPQLMGSPARVWVGTLRVGCPSRETEGEQSSLGRSAPGQALCFAWLRDCTAPTLLGVLKQSGERPWDEIHIVCGGPGYRHTGYSSASVFSWPRTACVLGLRAALLLPVRW